MHTPNLAIHPLARRSSHLAECQVDSLRAQQRMHAVLHRQHAVETHAIHTAPYDNITMRKRHPHRIVAPCKAAEQEPGRQAERHRYNRRDAVVLIAILMQCQPRARSVVVDQAGIRHVAGKAGRMAKGGNVSGSGVV